VWDGLREKFDAEVWNPRTKTFDDFVKRYGTYPQVINDLATLIRKKKRVPKGSFFPLEDILLITLLTLRNEKPLPLVEKFGGSSGSITNAANIGISAICGFEFVFAAVLENCISKTDLEKKFEENGVPHPEIAFVGDCLDIGVLFFPKNRFVRTSLLKMILFVTITLGKKNCTFCVYI
jgi:hypothetical protein